MYKRYLSAVKRLLFVLLLVACALAGRAQIYPVQVSIQVLPPYSVYLPDYASPGGEKLRLVLLQRDLTVQGYRIRFDMKVQVNGITIMQTSKSAAPPPIILQPGIPTVLGGSDLSWYVQPQNLEFGGGYSSSTYEQSRSLPEGPITITFTAYDYVRSDVQVSAHATSFFYATRDNPPLLNYPACGMQVTPISPQFLNFSWLPQNTSSPNSALQTNYIFSLWAVLPAGYNFQDIVQSTRPLYSVTTQAPTLVYGPGEPLLVPGQTYAWRVQAVDASGRDLFRNNGYSETCSFIYSGDGSQGIVNYPAIQINAASAGPAQGKIWWTVAGEGPGVPGTGGLAASGYDQYRLYYRKTRGNYNWFSVDVNDSMYRVFDLEPSTTYECRLQGHKAGSYGPYTDVVNFTTAAPKTIGCTDNTSMLSPYSGRPLAVATGGMKVNYGPWDVQLLTVQALGAQGQFKGTCKVTVPFMGGVSFNAKFDNLTIDDSRNVTAGNIEFLSQGMKSWIDSSISNQMGGSLYGKVVSGSDTTNVTVPRSLADLTQLPVTLGPDSTIASFTIPGQPPIVVTVNDSLREVTIKDSTGSTYALDNQGHLTHLTFADASLTGFFANPANVSSLDTLATGKGVVNFTDADAKYAFDSWKPFYAQGSTILTSQYEKLSGGSGDYYVSQKAIGSGESDIVGVSFRLADGMRGDSVVFATKKGERLIWDPKDSTLNLLGGPAADAQEVYALYPKPGGGYYSLGKLLVSAYEHKDFTVVLVPVADVDGTVPDVNVQYYQDSLNSIYNKVNVNWTLEPGAPYKDASWDLNRDGMLSMTGSSFLSNSLTGEPGALIKGYKNFASVAGTKKYIFVLNTSNGSTGEAGDLLGDMPRATQYGFIFLKANAVAGADPAATLAHELGHGQFNLEHTFSGDIALGTQGTTALYPNLMDYKVGNHLNLYKYQWNQVHQPGQVMGIFESDSAGEYAEGKYIVTSKDRIFLAPNGAPVFVPAKSKIASITVDQSIWPDWALYSFLYRVSENNYKEISIASGSLQNATFFGYRDFTTSDASYWAPNQGYQFHTGENTVTLIKKDPVSCKFRLYEVKMVFTANQLGGYVNGERNSPEDQSTYVLGQNISPVDSSNMLAMGGNCTALSGIKDKEYFNNSSGAGDNGNVILKDYSTGKGGKPFFSDDDKQRIFGQMDGLAKKLGLTVKVYLLNTGNPDYQSDSATAANDQSGSKILVILDEDRNTIRIHHSLTAPQWLLAAFPNGLQKCTADYVNSALDSLHANSFYKQASAPDQVIAEYSVALYRGIFGMLYCATDENALANGSNAAKFVGGAVHELIATVDVAGIVNGLFAMGKGVVTSTLDSYVTYIGNIKTAIGDIQNNTAIDPPTMIGLLLPPPLNQEVESVKKAVKIGQYFVRFYFTECDSFKLDNGRVVNMCPYRYGQITVMVVPIVLTAGEWAIAKASTLMADMAAKYAGDVLNAVTKLSAAEAAGATITKEGEKLLVHDAQDAAQVDVTIDKASAAGNVDATIEPSVTPGNVEVNTIEQAEEIVKKELGEDAAKEMMDDPEFKLKGTDKEWLIRIIQGQKYGKKVTGLFEDGTLINTFKEAGVDLTGYKMYPEVQLIIPGTSDFFVADNIFLKFDEEGALIDVYLNETKLTATTGLTTRQNAAFGELKDAAEKLANGIGDGTVEFEIRSVKFGKAMPAKLRIGSGKLISVHGNNGMDEIVTDALKFFKP